MLISSRNTLTDTLSRNVSPDIGLSTNPVKLARKMNYHSPYKEFLLTWCLYRTLAKTTDGKAMLSSLRPSNQINGLLVKPT